jgi:hypothetical protein
LRSIIRNVKICSFIISCCFCKPNV